MAKWLKFSILFLVFFLDVRVHAAGERESIGARESQFHFRVGQLNGSYSGVFKGDFETSGALDLDFEFFMKNQSSFFFRFIQALDTEDSRPFYTYAGSGMRYYMSGKGATVTQRDADMFISAQPKLRYYVGADLGIAQVIVKSFGPVVQSPANMLEVGLNFGTIYQLTKRLGVEVQVGGTLGYGLSSTAVNGSTVRALFGGSYYF